MKSKYSFSPRKKKVCGWFLLKQSWWGRRRRRRQRLKEGVFCYLILPRVAIMADHSEYYLDMTTSTSKPIPSTDQDQPYYIHSNHHDAQSPDSLSTWKRAWSIECLKMGLLFADYVQFAYEKECPPAPAIISCVPLRSSKRPAVCPIPTPFLGARKVCWGCCITAAFLRSLPSPECEEEKKEQKTRSPSGRLQDLYLEPKELKSWSIRQRLQTQLGQQYRWRTWQQIHRCRTHKQHLMAWRRHHLWNCQQQEWNWRNLIG